MGGSVMPTSSCLLECTLPLCLAEILCSPLLTSRSVSSIGLEGQEEYLVFFYTGVQPECAGDMIVLFSFFN